MGGRTRALRPLIAAAEADQARLGSVGSERRERDRAAAFFHDGNADAVITTLDPCRAADGTSAYPAVTVAEHLAQKLGGSRGLELNPHADREAARILPAATF